ncbi:MAG: hypothetical protein A2868_00125 [Candidatus Levybacteria bacterium RIFCSPHIGHO2_01_FULL_40_15b]|nr:MAG: hypothetical protein A2868_00125 [Candidatus Levybacteria bacterium RIFCSPHIGHO2_01_FULL_40_15b]
MQNSKLQFKVQNVKNFKLSTATFNFKLLTLNLWRSHNGQALVELLVAFAFASILLPGLITGLVASREGKAQQIQALSATGLLREAQEALRVVRETSWSQIETNGTFHPQISGSTWQLAPGQENINGYTRSIEISNTNRDSNGNIVESSGTNDPSTKKAVISVSWETPYQSEVTSTVYLARYLNNTTFIDTSEADFEAGSHSGTVTVNENGGEVVLGAGGGGDWCAPNLSITALDLPKNGVANAVYAIEGKAFAGTGDNASGISYASVSISNTDPPVATIGGTFDGYKTNDGIFGETNYAYLATDNNSKEAVIVDITQAINGKYAEAGYFNAPGNGNGLSVSVSGSIGIMTDASNNLYTFDLTSKTGSRPQLGSIALSGIGNRIYVSGNYIYVAETGSTQLEIIEFSNGGRNLLKVAQASVNGLDGRDVFVNTTGTRAYLATSASPTQKEFFIIDITNKTGERPALGSYESNGMNPEGINIVTGNKAILVGIGGEEYQVISITNESSPVRCGGLNVDAGVNGVSSVIEEDGDTFSYIITGDSTTEFKIIEGGPGGQFAITGTFTSSAFDASSTVAYNRIIPNIVEPLGTNLELQVAIASAVDDSCSNASYYFVGPDGTSNTFFATSSAIPSINNGQGYVNPGRCFKYKAFLSTTDPNASPILNDVTVNYSP